MVVKYFQMLWSAFFFSKLTSCQGFLQSLECTGIIPGKRKTEWVEVKGFSFGKMLIMSEGHHEQRFQVDTLDSEVVFWGKSVVPLISRGGLTPWE